MSDPEEIMYVRLFTVSPYAHQYPSEEFATAEEAGSRVTELLATDDFISINVYRTDRPKAAFRREDLSPAKGMEA